MPEQLYLILPFLYIIDNDPVLYEAITSLQLLSLSSLLIVLSF